MDTYVRKEWDGTYEIWEFTPDYRASMKIRSGFKTREYAEAIRKWRYEGGEHPGKEPEEDSQ